MPSAGLIGCRTESRSAVGVETHGGIGRMTDRKSFGCSRANALRTQNWMPTPIGCGRASEITDALKRWAALGNTKCFRDAQHPNY
jgi:hypothetical protein